MIHVKCWVSQVGYNNQVEYKRVRCLSLQRKKKKGKHSIEQVISTSSNANLQLGVQGWFMLNAGSVRLVIIIRLNTNVSGVCLYKGKKKKGKHSIEQVISTSSNANLQLGVQGWFMLNAGSVRLVIIIRLNTNVSGVCLYKGKKKKGKHSIEVWTSY